MPSAHKPIRAVLDTDTFNEVDDQFALAHLLLSPDEVQLEAVYAAPFLNSRSESPADGMEKSFEEIHRVIDLVKPATPPPVFRGSTAFLSGPAAPQSSEAVDDLIRRAMDTKHGKLHVAGIAVSTNLASALLIEPKIADRVVMVWLGGHASAWPDTNEFNLKQDLHATRVLLESSVPFIRLPCMPVTSHLLVSIPELECELAPHSRLGKYLTDIVRGYCVGEPPGYAKQIWDISASAWLMNPSWFSTMDVLALALRDDLTWGPPLSSGRIVREAYSVNRTAIFADFFAKAKKSD
jgi:purine nucleosidase